MKRMLGKIILYTASVCLVSLIVLGTWLYTSLNMKSGLSSDFIDRVVIGKFNENSKSIKIATDGITLRFLDNDDFLNVFAKNMIVTQKGAPLAKLQNMRMSLSLWNLITGDMPVKKIMVEGGVLEYEGTDSYATASIENVSKIIVQGLIGVTQNMQGLSRLELNSIDLRYSVKNTPLAIVSKSADVVIQKDKNTLSFEYLGAMLGRDRKERLVKTGMVSAKLRLKNYMTNTVGIYTNIEGLDSVVQAEVEGKYDIEKSEISINSNIMAGDIEIIKFFGVVPKNFPNVGGVAIELKTEAYNLTKGGKVFVSGIADETPFKGTVVIRDNMYADIDVKVQSVSSKILNKYWPKQYASQARNWMYKNIVGTYNGTMRTMLTFKNKFSMTPLRGDLELTEGLLDYFTPLPVAKIVKAKAHYSDKGIYITIEDGVINTELEDVNINGTKVDIIGVNDDAVLKVSSALRAKAITVKKILNNPAIKLVLPHKDLNAIKGTMSGDFALQANLSKEKIEKISFEGKVKDVKLKYFEQYQDISSKLLTISILNDRVKVMGNIIFDTNSKGYLQVTNKGKSNLSVQYSGRLSDKTIDGYDLKEHVVVKGGIKANVTYTTSKNISTIKLDTDLSQSDMYVPVLNWNNNRGDKTKLILTARIKNDVYSVHGDFVGSGAKNIYLKGKASSDKEGLISLNIKTLKFGTGILSISGKRKKNVFVVNAFSKNMYMKTIRAVLDSMPAGTGEQGLDATVNMEKIFSHAGIIGERVKFKIQKDDNQYNKIWMYLQTSRPASRSLISYDKKRMRLYSENVGVLYTFLTGAEPVRGGTITMAGKADDKGVIRGNAYVKNIEVIDVPESTRILKVFSIVGIFDALKTKFIDFNSIRGEFALKNGRFTTENISAIGKNIAMSAKGFVDFSQEKLDLKGMILPSYKLGNVLGHIPIIGALVTGVDKQGPITQRYTAVGGFSDYKVSVDSSGILTIGVLRNIFSIITGADDVPVIFTDEELNNTKN